MCFTRVDKNCDIALSTLTPSNAPTPSLLSLPALDGR